MTETAKVGLFLTAQAHMCELNRWWEGDVCVRCVVAVKSWLFVIWCRHRFQGPCGTTLPLALAPHESEVF